MSLQRQIKSCLKQFVFKSHWIVNCLSKCYQWSGYKPWSFGYSFYKFNYIEKVIKSNLDFFKNNRLPDSYGYSLDERVVEYPWFFSKLEKLSRFLLDAGSALNQYKILDLLKDRKIIISTLDFEGINSIDPMPSYIYEDLRQTVFKDNIFDAIVCISTLEHVGMDNTYYTSDQTKKEFDQTAYLTVIEEFKRILKKTGHLFLTIPYGRYKNHKNFQIFNNKMINQLISRFSPTHYSADYFLYENNQWQFSSREECEKYIEGYRIDQENSSLAAARSIVALKLIK